ncbi:MAG: phosphoglycerate kinase [Clostridiales bacterium]|nr:phosphoglycerate kinase [Clostridiales bacterium]
MFKKTIKNVDVAGKKCLVRCDFNVPMSGGEITDDTRIVAALPTIKYLIEHGAKVILCSHLGRPKGEFNLKYSLKPVAARLSTLLNTNVVFATDVIGEDATNKVGALKDGQVLLLENLRFHKEEEANDQEFCRSLSKFCDIYVNDAFGTAHRAHASTAGIVTYGFAPVAVAGFLIAKELESLDKVLDNPRRPLVAILGGAKVSDKIGVINNLLDKADTILIGGGMAYTFLRAKGIQIGKSLCEEDKLPLAKELIAKADERRVKLLLPIDAVVTQSFPDPIDADVPSKQVMINEIDNDSMALDIGDETVKLFKKEIESAGTVVWNGPMGVFENPNFAKGTREIAWALAGSNCISVVGGGDSAAAVQQMEVGDKITHISTGGGASLEYLEGKVLPGIACLNNN